MVAQTTAARRMQQGLCVECGENPPVRGILRCDACKRMLSDRARRRVEERARSGLCVSCGKRPARSDRATCELCCLKTANTIRRARKRRTADGLCSDCGLAPALPGLKVCTACREAGRKRIERSRAERMSRGNCWQCANPPAPGKKYCVACLGRAKEERASRKASGLCLRCGKHDAASGTVLMSGLLGPRLPLPKAPKGGEEAGRSLPGVRRTARGGADLVSGLHRRRQRRFQEGPPGSKGIGPLRRVRA